MKQIFKKNQIIITALALMICTAGYLQFANQEDENAQAVQSDTVYFETAKEDGTTAETSGAGLYADISEEDRLAMQQENEAAAEASAGTGTEEEASVGEAVLVSTIISGNFSTNAKLVREQRRAQSKETLMDIINNELLTEDQKQIAVESLVELTTIAEKENAAELLLEAKGFADPIVNIAEGEVDVVINASSVTDQQVAQIEDIVTRKTGFEPKNITITAAIQEE